MDIPLRIRSATWLLTAFIGSAVWQLDGAQAVRCDQTLRPVRGQLGYALRTDRCEGLYEPPYGSSIELASLTAGPPSFPRDLQNRTSVRLPKLDSVGDARVNIRIQALVPEIYYRLDSQRPLGTTFDWPLSDVLTGAGLGPSDLGYLAWVLDKQGTELFLPAIVDARAAGNARLDSVTAIMRVSLPTELVYWRLYRLENPQTTSQPGWTKIVLGPGEQTGPVSISLPLSGTGITQVNVQAKIANRDVFDQVNFRIAH